MITYNHVSLIGVLTRDPDIKSVGERGTKLARLSLCINEKRKTQDGKIVATPVFVDVEAWARMADMCEKYLTKNSLILVDGKLQMAQWEKDGVQHQKLKVSAASLKFLPNGRKFAGPKSSSHRAEDGKPLGQGDETVVDSATQPEEDVEFAEAFDNW